MIAITGASGEIGGRLAQACFERNIPVRLLVRNIDPRLARYSNADIRRVDVTNFEDLKANLVGCNALINCAIDKSNTDDEPGLIERNKKFFTNLLEASIEAGIEKFVELSSISVLPPRITNAVLQNEYGYCTGTEYADWYANIKIATEKIAIGYKDKINLVIIRPGMVYGPFMHWSKLVFMRTMFHRHVLPTGNTLCHALHVDDLVDLMLFAADKKNTLPMLVYGVNPEPVLWQQYFDYHSAAAGYSLAAVLAESEIRQLQKIGGDVLSKPGIKRWVIDFLRKVVTAMPQGIKNMGIIRKSIYKLKAMNYGLLNYDSYINPPKAKTLPYFMPNRFETELFLTDTPIPSDKNATANGFTYKIPLKKGAEMAAQWWKFKV